MSAERFDIEEIGAEGAELARYRVSGGARVLMGVVKHLTKVGYADYGEHREISHHRRPIRPGTPRQATAPRRLSLICPVTSLSLTTCK